MNGRANTSAALSTSRFIHRKILIRLFQGWLFLSVAIDNEAFYLVVPDSREKDVVLQLSRPSIKQIKIPIEYILFSELRQHCDALCKFGESHKIMNKITKSV
jgi:type II restriction enzyme